MSYKGSRYMYIVLFRVKSGERFDDGGILRETVKAVYMTLNKLGRKCGIKR